MGSSRRGELLRRLDRRRAECRADALSFDQTFPARWLVNLEATRRIAEKLTVAVGAENAFSAYPEKDARLSQINNGIIYPQFSPFGFNGGFWYVRVSTKFK